MKVNKCIFCLETKELLKAHIIPDAFFKSLKSSAGKPAIRLDDSPFRKKAPKGEYDDKILCKGCEKDHFEKLDDYAIKLLIPPIKENPNASKEVYLKIGPYNLSKLTLFVLSVLWRGHHSKRPFFKKIGLGPYEERIKESITSPKDNLCSKYPIAIVRYSDKMGQGSIPSPEPVKFANLNFYNIELGYGYSCLVKVDNRPLPDEHKNNFLKPGELTVVQFDYKGTLKHKRERKFFSEWMGKRGR